ncbi:hypothetical protein [Pseudonocardia ailaonensis]|uniref:hypothetical protein n=1 Tax=Pseudonocardia ailaonensis TaxID=367279 RepID=UPI0031CE9BF7
MTEEDFAEFAWREGWTDGLPVVAPTPARVDRLLAEVDLDRAHVVGVIGPRGGEATVERIAVNAVLAGCPPETFPVVVAAAGLLAAPAMNIAAVQATTSAATPAIIVNGPIRARAGLHGGRGALGPGYRANATIGRAVRLMLLNIGGGVPDEIDRSSHGLPSKFGVCFAENEEESPWPGLAAVRGHPGSAVTMTSIISLTNVRLPDPRPGAVDDEIAIIADALATRGHKHVQSGAGNPVLVLSPGTAAILDRSGFDRDRLAEAVFEVARRDGSGYTDQPLTRYRREGRGGRVLPYGSPDDLVVVVAGGPEPNQALILSSFVDSPVLTVPIA